LFPQFSQCSMVSKQNREDVEQLIPAMRGKVTVIPNGVDTDLNSPGIARPIPNTLIYNGALTYRANLDAMVYFTREILPQIHSLAPDVNLKITGRNQGVNLRRLHDDKRIQLTGYLEDVRPAVSGSWICVVPLRDGSGSRLKILEAMALGTPIVSTSKGAEGLEVTHEKDILIGDTPEEFAQQTLRLLGDVDLRNRLVRNARTLVEEKYSWRQISEQFCQWVESMSSKC
jgi:glycosyltransferase involved in cell wall biosynthesis